MPSKMIKKIKKYIFNETEYFKNCCNKLFYNSY